MSLWPPQTSASLSFRAWDVAYPGLAAQFAAAGWNASVNHWDRIYDFSPAEPDAAPTFTIRAAEDQSRTRWCELTLAPEGLCGGSVEEHVGADPATPGCECPCLAADGTPYAAIWYTAAAGSGVAAPEDVVVEVAAPAPDSTLNTDGSYKLGEQPFGTSARAVTGEAAPPSLFAEWAASFKGALDGLFGAALRLVGLGTAAPASAAAPPGASTACLVQ